MKKRTQAASVIRGEDGPTAVFIVSKNAKLTPRQKLERFKNKIKRFYVEKTIRCESHSLDEVMEYLVNQHGFVEVEGMENTEEYREMRASFIIQYAPELLGEYATIPKLKSKSNEDIQAYLKQTEAQMQRAMEVPKEQFDIDFHRFKKSFDDKNSSVEITIEKKYACIGGGAGGSKKVIRKFKKIEKDVYRYYGVTEEDIKEKSDRYQELVRTLIR